jgi:NhaA family Na+:H+ antiporter
MKPIRLATEKAAAMLQEFLRLESAGGILLAGTALLAIALANSPLAGHYTQALDARLAITLGGYGLDKPLLLWINDGLMAVFFLLVGLELKREVLEGQLSSPGQFGLPAVAALGGVAVPAIVYTVLTQAAPGARGGWAIPTATDIAFAMAVLSLLGSRVPVSLKVFLVTVAVIDDLAAVIIIALFYTADLDLFNMLLAVAGTAVLAILNRAGVRRIAPYVLVGTFIWLSVLKSGVHATLAGVVVAAFIPLRADDDSSPARHLEHTLHPWIAFGVLPVFAFANAGVSLRGFDAGALAGPITAGIATGLFLGKQLGVFGMTAIAIRSGLARMPEGLKWVHLYGAALLCGVGFTMSLFIGALAFEHGDMQQVAAVKIGVIAGSMASALLGWLVLRLSLPQG